MNRQRLFTLHILTLLLLTGWLFVPVSSVLAHDPGLSRATVQLDAEGILLHIVLAQQNIEMLVPIDTNGDGTVSAGELSAARARLQSMITAGIELSSANQRLQPKRARVETASGDAVNVELYYDRPDAAAVHLRIPLIGQLARGHRQYLTVQDTNGDLLGQHILNASSSPVLVQERRADGVGVFRQYVWDGVWHIWIGFDHILFLLTLLLPAVLVYRHACWQARLALRPAMTDILKVVTAFTLAHSITLALAVLDMVVLPPRLVESVIAFSVLLTAANNLWPVFSASRWLLAFVFGLVHGFGFASALIDLGLPGDALAVSLLGFNLGVEAGQLIIVAAVFPIAACLRHTRLYRIGVFSGGSAVAALIATVWMFERVFDVAILPSLH